MFKLYAIKQWFFSKMFYICIFKSKLSYLISLISTIIVFKNFQKYLLKEMKYTDCSEILKNDRGKKNQDGVYTIYPDQKTAKKVFCDMTINGGGWTVCSFV